MKVKWTVKRHWKQKGLWVREVGYERCGEESGGWDMMGTSLCEVQWIHGGSKQAGGTRWMMRSDGFGA